MANLQQTATNGNVVHHAISRTVQLTQAGLSNLGTFKAPTFPDFLSGVSLSNADARYPRLTEKPLQNGFPWGPRTAARTNPYENSPTTGRSLAGTLFAPLPFSRGGRSIASMILTFPRCCPLLRPHHLTRLYRSRRCE